MLIRSGVDQFDARATALEESIRSDGESLSSLIKYQSGVDQREARLTAMVEQRLRSRRRREHGGA